MYMKRSSIAKQHETTGRGAHGSAVHEHPFRVEKEQSMKKNMGAIDRIIRVILAVVVGILYVTGQISGLAAVIFGVFAVIFLVTSAVAFCPLYVPLGISTIRKK